MYKRQQLPSVKTVGEGRAIILHKGKLLDARWKRGSNLDPFHIVDKNDNILYVPKGKVWISLVPNTKKSFFWLNKFTFSKKKW